MVVKEKTEEKITISFSGRVGKEGLSRIKNYIEFLENNAVVLPKRKTSAAKIAKLADEVTVAAFEKFKRAKKIK